MSTWDDLRGWLDQRDDAHAAAVTAADHAGYARGHQAGHTLGREEGYAVGYSEGYAKGRAEQPTPEPPLPHRMQVGAALGYRQAGRGAAYVLDYNQKCGPITITRNYDATVNPTKGPKDIPELVLSAQQGWDLCLSIKPGGESTEVYRNMASGAFDQQVQAYLDRWNPSQGGYLLIGNEPDQNKKNIDPSAFRAGVEHLLGAVTLPPNVKPGIALMRYSWAEYNPRRLTKQWFPEVEGLTLSIHVYGSSAWRTPQDELDRVLADLPATWGWGVGETNAAEDPKDPGRKARYLTDLADYTYAHGGRFFLPFGAPSAPEAENREINTSPQVQAALKALAVKYGA